MGVGLFHSMSQQRLFSLVISLYFFAGLSIEAAALTEFEVFRLLQYEDDSRYHGSWKAGFHLPVAHRSSQSLERSRHTALVPISELFDQHTRETFLEYGGLVVMLPNTSCPLNVSLDEACWFTGWHNEVPSDELGLESLDQLRDVERWMIRQQFTGAVYFAWSSPDLLQLYRQSLIETAHSALMHPLRSKLVFEVKPSIKIEKLDSLRGDNISGWLAGSRQSRTGGVLPTLAIVTYYDSIAVAPSLAKAVQSNGSGLLAVLELTRLFKRITEIVGQPKYNILFLVTSGSVSNFSGLQSWLATARPVMAASIEFALCVDTIADATLSLHLSRTPTAPEPNRFIASMVGAARRYNVPFEQRHKKIKVYDPELPWQHEMFALHKITAGTISSLEYSEPVLTRGSIFDRQLTPAQRSNLKVNIKTITAAMLQHAYELPNDAIENLEVATRPNETFIEAWESLLQSNTRFFPTLSARSPVVSQIWQTFDANLSQVKREPFVSSDTSKIFYTDHPTTMRAIYTKGLLFDLIHFFCTLSGLLLMFVTINTLADKDLKQKLNYG